MARRYWLVKQEPSKYSFDQLLADGCTTWDGVRNFQARNNLQAMRGVSARRGPASKGASRRGRAQRGGVVLSFGRLGRWRSPIQASAARWLATVSAGGGLRLSVHH